MHDQEKLELAWKYGHFWNKQKPDVLNVDQSSVKKLTIDHPIARQAIASWQEADANLDLLVMYHHRRATIFDGLIGPATNILIQAPRCAMPDHPPPPNALFDYGNPELNAAVASYQQWAEHRDQIQATGSGSWPVGCDPLRKDVHSVVVRIDFSNAGSTQKSMMDEVLKMVEETEAEIGQAVRHVKGDYADPQHDVKFQYIAGGVIGFAYFPTPNKCKQTVTARIDNSFQPRSFVLSELLTHEYKGHSDGLEHTRGGIMNPSIGSPSKHPSWVGDTSYNRKKAYFGGEPIPSPNPPPPSPPPPSPPPPSHPLISGLVHGEQVPNVGIAIRGEVSLQLSSGKFDYIIVPVSGQAGKFQFTPKPRI